MAQCVEYFGMCTGVPVRCKFEHHKGLTRVEYWNVYWSAC